MGSSSDPPPVPTDGSPETEDIQELRARVDELERDLAYSRELVREVIATSNAQAAELKRARSDYRRLRGRRPVRLMVALATRGREVARRIRSAARLPREAAAVMTRPIRERRRVRQLQASPAAEQALVSAVRQGGSQSPPPDHGPLVSIVIVQRDGAASLERCLRGLAPTTYRDVEIIVVGDGTSDLSALADEQPGGAIAAQAAPIPRRGVVPGRGLPGRRDRPGPPAVLPRRRHRADRRPVARLSRRDPRLDRCRRCRSEAHLRAPSRRAAGGSTACRADARSRRDHLRSGRRHPDSADPGRGRGSDDTRRGRRRRSSRPDPGMPPRAAVDVRRCRRAPDR